MCINSVQFQMEIRKISRRCSNTQNFGHFTFLGTFSNDNGVAEKNWIYILAWNFAGASICKFIGLGTCL